MEHDLVSRFQARIHGPRGRTVVLGQGFGTNQTIWEPYVEALVAHGFRVVTYDAAGVTPATLSLYQAERHDSLYGFAEDLIALMRELGISGASYVGHSVGGLIGMLAAGGEPGLFDSLSTIGSSACYIDHPADGYIGGFSREQVDGIIEAMRQDYAAWANGFAALFMDNPDRLHLALEFSRSLLAMRPDIASAVLDTIFHADHRSDVARLNVRTQVLQTARDPAVPLAAAQWLAHASKACEFRILETEGHFPHVSAPELVKAALLPFLRTHAE